jgi:large subunit ribosomal protein L25
MAKSSISVRERVPGGSAAARRLRASGLVPAVVYGHGSPAEPVACPRKEIERVLDAGHHMVEIRAHGEVSPGWDVPEARKAIVKEVQVDPVTQQVLHVDFVEVSAREIISVTVPLVFRGEAPGVKEGGSQEVNLHEITIRCPADGVPDDLRVDVSGLGLGESIHVGELELPGGVSAETPAEQVVVTCRRPRGVVEEEEVPAAEAAEAAQPEVIAEKKREEREQEEG